MRLKRLRFKYSAELFPKYSPRFQYVKINRFSSVIDCKLQLIRSYLCIVVHCLSGEAIEFLSNMGFVKISSWIFGGV